MSTVTSQTIPYLKLVPAHRGVCTPKTWSKVEKLKHGKYRSTRLFLTPEYRSR